MMFQTIQNRAMLILKGKALHARTATAIPFIYATNVVAIADGITVITPNAHAVIHSVHTNAKREKRSFF